MTVQGIDISHWQGLVDWDKLNANPDVGFVIMKGTEADGFTDSRFVRNWTLCKKPKSVYHFWRYAVAGADQAQYFFNEVSPTVGAEKMRPSFDYEDTAATKLGNIASNMREFHEAAQAKWYGRMPIVYTGAWWWDPWVGRDLFSSNPLWIAHYPKWWKDASGNWRVAISFAEMLGYLALHPEAKPYLPKTGGWTQWKMWQFTSSGRIDGISGNVDLNLFNGDENELRALLYTDAPPPPPPPAGDWDEARVAALEGLTAEQGARILAVEAKLAAVKEAL